MIPRTTGTLVVCLLSGAGIASADVVDSAARLIGRPYVWGAEGPNSFDCSGLTQYVFQKHGIELPRRAVSRSKVGDRVGRKLRRGDLMFFSTDTRRSLVTHVGIYEGNGVMIDASKRHGLVRRDDLDDEYWAERFMFARRMDADSGSWEDVLPDPRDRLPEPEAGRRTDKRAETLRTLGRLAEALLRRPR